MICKIVPLDEFNGRTRFSACAERVGWQLIEQDEAMRKPLFVAAAPNAQPRDRGGDARRFGTLELGVPDV